MNSLPQLLGPIAGFFGLVSSIPYIHSIFKGKTKPERATFAIWSMIGVLSTTSYIASGAKETIYLPIAFNTIIVLIFILSLKYGVGGFTKLDIACLTGGFIGIVFWIVTKNPLTALYISTFVNCLGFIPTVKKSYLHPETENTLAWCIGSFAGLLNLFAITSFTLEVFLYPFSTFLGDALVATLLLTSRTRLLKRRS